MKNTISWPYCIRNLSFFAVQFCYMCSIIWAWQFCYYGNILCSRPQYSSSKFKACLGTFHSIPFHFDACKWCLICMFLNTTRHIKVNKLRYAVNYPYCEKEHCINSALISFMKAPNKTFRAEVLASVRKKSACKKWYRRERYWVQNNLFTITRLRQWTSR